MKLIIKKLGINKKFIIILGFLPVGFMILIQSLGWPNNFDDFYRGFNGISPDHDVLSYGWMKSEEMVKHIVHDPLLTWSNQFDYRYPFLSGVIETIILLYFMYIVTLLSLKGNHKDIAFSTMVLFNILVGVQAYTFLPPGAFPLAFSTTFLITILANTRFDALSIDNLRISEKKKRAPLNTMTTISLVALEQIAFLFYASNFFQSILFWATSNCQRIAHHRKKKSLRTVFKHPNLWSGARFVPFIIINLIWRSKYGANGAENFSESLSIFNGGIAAIKWNLAGTDLGGFLGMSPRATALWSQPLWMIILSILIGAMVFYFARWVINQQKPQKINTLRSDKLIVNLLLLGISISIGWTIPALSARYYQELMEVKTQTYVASRFAALGFILTISILVGLVISHLKTQQWKLLATIIIISSISLPQNIESLADKYTRTSLRLTDVCSGKGDWNHKLLLPKEIISPGVDTRIWLTSYEKKYLDSSIEIKRQAAINQFEANSMQFCN